MALDRVGIAWRGFAVAAVLVAGAAAAGAQPAPPRVTPVPAVRGPVAVTAGSYPYMTASRLIEPADLASAGFVEEEFFLSGTANVYDWPAPGQLTVRTANAPYTTRILVRRPSDPAKFSGTVVVEVMHTPNAQDFSLMWGWTHKYFLEHQDAYVAITVMPVAAQALTVFDPVRYASISFANPAPGACPGGGAGAGDPAVEEGLRWDMISQLGALLKSTVPGRPLATLKVEKVYMTTQDAILQTYINAVHPHAKLANGQFVYDGYVVKGGFRSARINRCAEPPENADPRNQMRHVGVPVIQLQMEGDLPNAVAGRRPDSDEPADRFRLWEVAGTAHFDSAGYRGGFPNYADMMRGGLAMPVRPLAPEMSGMTFPNAFLEPSVAQCSPPITTEQPILAYMFHNAFARLDQWVRTGVAPPRAERIEMTGLGTPQAAVVKDVYGNAKGGVRTPLVDVPASTYHAFHENSPARLCRQFGWEEPFTWSRLEQVHGSYANYAARLTAAIDRAVKERWLLERDGQRLKAEMLSGPSPAAAPATR